MKTASNKISGILFDLAFNLSNAVAMIQIVYIHIHVSTFDVKSDLMYYNMLAIVRTKESTKITLARLNEQYPKCKCNEI